MNLAFSLLSNCWDFATRHPGILLVLLGVAGEIIFDWKDMKGRLAWAKRISALVLIAGLILEFSEAAKSDKDVAASIERAGNAEKEAEDAGLLAAKIGITNAQLSMRVEDLRSNNLVVDKRLTDEANAAHKAAGEANVRAALIESNNYALSLTVEGLHSNNLLTERQVEELRKQNLQLETRMINGLYARTYLEVFSINDLKHVTVQHSGMNTRVFFILSKVPVPISIYAT